MLSYTAMTVVDSIYVGQLGTEPLAAIGISTSLIFLGTAFGNGLLGGVRVHIAKSHGAGLVQDEGVFAWQGIWIALAMGFLVALFAPLGPWAFQLMGASEAVNPLASSYFALRTLAAPLVFLHAAMAAWFNGRGDTRSTMVAALVANGLNIVLDPFLIFGISVFPALGIEGAALTTVLGMAAGNLVLVACGAHQLLRRVVGPSAQALREVWHIGAPTGVQYVLDVGSFTVFTALLARAGDAHLAAHVIAVRVVMVSFMPGNAIGQATGVLVGQSLGAGRPDRARQALGAARVQATLLMLGCAIAFLCFPDALISVFGAEDKVRAIATQVLVIAAAIQVFDAMATVALGALTGAGDTRFVLGMTVAAAWLITVPLGTLFVLGLGLGAMGAWMAVGLEITFLAFAATWRTRGSAWLVQMTTSRAAPVRAAAAK
jgi:MATE family multidrug resistance protein